MSATAHKNWRIARKWEGQPAFILCGGTSVTDADIESLKGRNVIVVNGSYRKALWAPILFFADQRWWLREMRRDDNLLPKFEGLICTTSRQATGLKLYRLKRETPSEQCPSDRSTVRLRRTSLLSAMDVAFHRGASQLILVGADNRDGEDGRAHHHTEYPWNRPKSTWDVKVDDLRKAATSFRNQGIPIVNTSPITTLRFWPRRPLVDVIAELDNA